MNKHDWVDLMNTYGRLFVQIFCPPFGVLANECYLILKSETYKFRNILPKLVLAWFVCLILGSFIQQVSWMKDIYPVIILTIAFSYRRSADFIRNDLFKFVLKYLNSKNSNDE